MEVDISNMSSTKDDKGSNGNGQTSLKWSQDGGLYRSHQGMGLVERDRPHQELLIRDKDMRGIHIDANPVLFGGMTQDGLRAKKSDRSRGL